MRVAKPLCSDKASRTNPQLWLPFHCKNSLFKQILSMKHQTHCSKNHCYSYLVIALCMMAFLPLNLSAQADEEGDGIDLGFTEPQDNGLDFSYAPAPAIDRQVVVLYSTFARVYIKFNGGNTIGITPIDYTVGLQSNTFVSASAFDEELTIATVPLNSTVSIFSYDSDGIRRKVGEVNTKRNTEETIPLSMNLYYPITNWLQEGENASSNLYSLVASIPDANYLEKAYFIQQFFYGGNPFLDSDAGELPEVPPTVPEGGCLCRPLQLSVLQSATPVGGQEWIDNNNGNYLPDYVTGESTTQHFGNNDRGKRWYAYSHEGAAKYQQVWIETRKCVGGNNKMQMDNLSSNGPGSAAGPSAGNRSMLSYTFACVGIDDFRPEDCPCERTRKVEVCWKYAAQANVNVDLRSGWCWNGRGVWGGATDVATVMWGYSELDPSNMPMPIDANIITAGSGCSMNFDEAKLAVNLFKTALYGYKTIKSLGAPDPGFSEQLWGLLYGNLAADAIKNLFSDDYVDTTGSCGTEVDPGGTLIEGCKKFDLETNKRFVIVLLSNSKLIVEGYGKYRGNARILSSHALSGAISPSAPDQSGENCCSNGHGAYSLSSFYPGMGTSSAQTWVRGKFIDAGLNNVPGINLNITGEFGYRGGGEREGCKLVIVDERNDGGEGNLQKDAIQNLSLLNNAVWLFNQPQGQDWQFSVMDANGRMVHTSNGASSDLLLFDFEKSTLPGGMYFIQLRDKSGVESLKLVKSK
jgi:hypothetical protein